MTFRSTLAVSNGRGLAGGGMPGSASDHHSEPTSDSAVVVAPARYVLLPLAQVLTGYSVKAMQRKIERGDWPEDKVWKHAPDGHIVIDMMGYQKWVEGR